MTFDGVIKFIWPEMGVWQNNIPKITFVLEENVDKEFKSSISIDILWEKTGLIKQYKVWDVVKVFLNFKATEYQDKWFNRITAWKIEWSSAAPTGEDNKPADDLPF